MKIKWKRYVALLCAIALVITCGVFASDRFLRATDGQENLVEESTEEVGTEVIGEIPQEVTPEEVVSVEEGVFESDFAGFDEATPNQDAENDATEPEDSNDQQEPEDGQEPDVNQEENPEDQPQEKSVVVTSNVGSDDTLTEGMEITMTAKLSGFENENYTLQWQSSSDGENWEDVADATDLTYTFILTEETSLLSWRVQVNTED